MATTTEGRRLTEAHRQAQARLAAQTVVRFSSLWGLVNPRDVEASLASWLDAALLLVSAQFGTSSALARRYYRTFRTFETGVAPETVSSVAFNREKATVSLLTTGPYLLRKQAGQGVPIQQAYQRAITESSGAAVKESLHGSRETIQEAVRADRRALGWQRVTDGSPCAFCALLASRGPTYKSASGADFQAHNRCGCVAEPVYSRDTALAPGADRWSELYNEAAKGTEDPLNAFRRAYESQNSA